MIGAIITLESRFDTDAIGVSAAARVAVTADMWADAEAPDFVCLRPYHGHIPSLTWQSATAKMPRFLPQQESAMILTINRSQISPDIDVLQMNGRIVLGNDARAVEWKVDELLKENRKKVIFDLGHVTVLDSTGIGIVVMCLARLKKSGGSLHIAGANGMVEQTLRMTNVDRLIELYPSVSEAAAAFSVRN